ncbi:MAG: hypothetical protein ACLGH0_12860 [Thermoanaerobaculia bacterium]
MTHALVTVATFWYFGDAEMAKSALDAAGIDATIDDEEIVRVNWLNANAVGGVKLRVRQEDALRAGEVLNQQPEPLGDADEAVDETIVDPSLCVFCGEPEVAPWPRWRFLVAALIMGIAVGVGAGLTEAAFFGVLAVAIFLLIAGRWRCRACGESWS